MKTNRKLHPILKTICVIYLYCSYCHALKLNVASTSSYSSRQVDLLSESKLIAITLMETQNFIYSNEIKSPDIDFKFFLQSKVLRRLQGAIDRWMSYEQKFREQVISDSYVQVQVFDEAIVSLANSRALLGYVYWKSNYDAIATQLLESSCPLLWEYHAIIKSPDAYSWFDCYISLRDLYDRNSFKGLKDFDTAFDHRFPWIFNVIYDKSATSSRLHPRSTLSELSRVSRNDLVTISSESRRGWAASEEIKSLLVSAISEFVINDVKEKRREIFQRVKSSVDEIIGKFVKGTTSFDMENSIEDGEQFKQIGSSWKIMDSNNDDKLKSDLLSEYVLLNLKNEEKIADIDLSSFRRRALREDLLHMIQSETKNYLSIMQRLIELTNDGDVPEILLENILRTDNFDDLSSSMNTSLGLGYQNFSEVLHVYEIYARQYYDSIKRQSTKIDRKIAMKKGKTTSSNASLDQKFKFKKSPYGWQYIKNMFQEYWFTIVIMSSAGFLIHYFTRKLSDSTTMKRMVSKFGSKRTLTKKGNESIKSNFMEFNISNIYIQIERICSLFLRKFHLISTPKLTLKENSANCNEIDLTTIYDFIDFNQHSNSSKLNRNTKQRSSYRNGSVSSSSSSSSRHQNHSNNSNSNKGIKTLKQYKNNDTSLDESKDNENEEISHKTQVIKCETNSEQVLHSTLIPNDDNDNDDDDDNHKNDKEMISTNLISSTFRDTSNSFEFVSKSDDFLDDSNVYDLNYESIDSNDMDSDKYGWIVASPRDNHRHQKISSSKSFKKQNNIRTTTNHKSSKYVCDTKVLSSPSSQSCLSKKIVPSSNSSISKLSNKSSSPSSSSIAREALLHIIHHSNKESNQRNNHPVISSTVQSLDSFVSRDTRFTKNDESDLLSLTDSESSNGQDHRLHHSHENHVSNNSTNNNSNNNSSNSNDNNNNSSSNPMIVGNGDSYPSIMYVYSPVYPTSYSIPTTLDQGNQGSDGSVTIMSTDSTPFYQYFDPNMVPPGYYPVPVPYPPIYYPLPPSSTPLDFNQIPVPVQVPSMFPPYYGNNGYDYQSTNYETSFNESQGNSPDLKMMIKQQMEYYFSEENLSKDMYLRSKMDRDGYVKLSEIFNFRRMKKLNASPALILTAARSSQMLEVSESWAMKASMSQDSSLSSFSVEAILQCRVRCADNPLKWVLVDTGKKSTLPRVPLE